ncbi:MAG: hypothetical protein LAT52_08385 [Balneolales bacterium]|nr:hypothetical protein [Balneolales bacterium]
MAERILDYIRKPERVPETVAEIRTDDDLEKIFDMLGSHAGTDFSNYKRATIARRLKKRLDALNI